MSWGALGAGTRIILVGALLAAEGLAAGRIGYPSFDFRNAILVLVTGLVLGGAGLAAWHRARWSRTGPLLVIAAAAWYIGGFRWVAYEPAAQLADGLDLVYAAVVAHAALTYPTGRVPSTLVGLSVMAGYLAAVLPVPRADVLVALVLLLALAATWLREPLLRGQRGPAMTSGVVFALVLASYRLVPPVVGGLAWLDTRPFLQLALAAVAIELAGPLIRWPARSRRVTDVVAELATDPGSELAHELGELVGDPGARIGFWDDAQQRFLDAQGRPIEMAAAGDRVSTVIEMDGTPLAMVEHRGSVMVDARTRIAIARAVELAATNARLQAEIRDQLVDVRDSRRRLLLAADEERLRLEHELFESLDPQLDELESTLSDAGLRDDVTAGSALELVRRTRREIVSLIRGWGPPALGAQGLRGALEDVVGRVALPVELSMDDVGQPSRLARSTLVFVASEALSNVAKHADAKSVRVRLTRTDDDVCLEVDDDGRGGARFAAGTGLLGLRDRVEAMGGWLSIVSRPGDGTHLRAVVPVRDVGS